MYIVAVHSWQKEEAEVAKTIADLLGTVIFEARQKISGGGPAVITNFADQHRAETLAEKLTKDGVPALVIDTDAVRSRTEMFHVRRFVLESQRLRLESFSGESCDINYDIIDLMLVATCNSGQTRTTGTVSERKFSIGKTLLAGGLPMTKKVTREETVIIEERCETLWLYAQGQATVIFDRAAMNYDGLGTEMQFTRDLNFTHLKKELRRLSPQAIYDDRLLTRPRLVRLLGPALNPETNLDLAFAILARSHRERPDTEAPPL